MGLLAGLELPCGSSLVSHPDTHKYPNKLLEVLKKILPLDSVLHQYMSEGSFEMCLPVLSLFITFGESPTAC